MNAVDLLDDLVERIEDQSEVVADLSDIPDLIVGFHEYVRGKMDMVEG